uniref:DNA-directed RNA polymerase n=1 Tax=Caulerpa ashmeadii TaxID=177078 RepID=A0A6B9VYB4_9CHLO|nr:RNA polymerase, beta subunit 2 [Caulerpa ashmeadii]QHQ73292.1 RNA polymerase, beta subunit 2 [Caulerpa ashmeadii]
MKINQYQNQIYLGWKKFFFNFENLNLYISFPLLKTKAERQRNRNIRGRFWKRLSSPLNYSKAASPKGHHIFFKGLNKTNQNTYLFHRGFAKQLQWVQKGDLLADCSASSKGELALGKNLLTAYMPWEGLNFEDAVLINQKVITKYTSLHIEKYDVEILENEKLTSNLPLRENPEPLLKENGIIRIGSWVQEGDILVGKITSRLSQKQLSLEKQNLNLNIVQYEQLLYDIVGQDLIKIQENSLRVPSGISGRIIKISICYQKQMVSPNILGRSLPRKTKSTTKDEVYPPPRRIPRSKLTNLLTTEYTIPYTYPFPSPKPQPPVGPLGNNRRAYGAPQQQKEYEDRTERCISWYTSWGGGGGTSSFVLRPSSRCFQHKRVWWWSLFIQFSNINFQKFSSPRPPQFLKNQPKQFIRKSKIVKVVIYIATQRELKVGDKISGRHGNKGILSKIFGNYDMPFLLNGECLDILLNPLGVPSRMNVGQIFECILGLTGHIFQTKFQTVCFDEMNGYEASRSFIYSKLLKSANQTKQKWLFSKKTPGKMNIFDGRDGLIFHQSVLVGYAYIMKLIHIVDEKINARSTGAYSLITQQPLRGRAKQGGQRVGEMEVWALQGFGSAYTLQELLTVKSDDLMGRNRLMLTLLKNTPLNFGTPESLRVVLRELQSLCLDLNILY